MVRAIQQIETDLKALEQKVSAIAQQIEEAYEDYIQLLGETLQNQLTFSVYQICTQEYPEAFLKLSLSQQQALQKQIRDLGQKAQANFQLGGEILQQIEWNDEQATALEEMLSEEEDNAETSDQKDSNSNFNLETLQALLQSGQSPSDENSPENVKVWCYLQAEAITMILENVSSQANTVLQQAGVLPQELPKEMIDAAIQSEGAGTISNRAPGVLHLMLELERKDQQDQSHSSDDEENEVMQLSIVRLRVGELEFSAPNLNTKRRTLRTLEQQLQQLDEQYRKLNKERAIAQAELAWRSSWHNDEQ